MSETRRTYRQRKLMTQRLNKAVEMINGRAMVRASTVASVFGRSPRSWGNISRRHGIERTKIRVVVDGHQPPYHITYFPLDQSLAVVPIYAATRTRLAWSAEEVRWLKQWIGYHRVAVIAEKLGRDPSGVSHYMQSNGITEQSVFLERGYVSGGKLAQLAGVTSHAVMQWRKRGLPGIKGVTGPGYYYHRLEDVQAFLATQRETLLRMHPDHRRLLRIPIEALEAA